MLACHRFCNENEDKTVVSFGNLYDCFPLYIGKVTYKKNYAMLKPETLYDSYVIIHQTSNKQKYTIANKNYILNAGQTAIVLPGETYSTAEENFEKSKLVYFIINIDNLKDEFLSADSDEAHQIKKSFNRIFSKIKVINTDHSFGNSLYDLFYLSESSDPFLKATIRNRITDILINILKCGINVEKEKLNTEDIFVHKVLEYIEDHIKDYISVHELAEVFNLSYSGFQLKFKQHIGYPPGDYITRQKLDTAKEMLSSTQMSVTDIAYELSYSSSQYFCYVFKQYNGYTPSEYRKNKCIKTSNSHTS